ncbi:hypothetical protein EEB14_35030 [Rhodococcus sp. WS4]|nr:hypothetical protein EEB14_35030 [Rhodococcus sp. WS4]
MSDNRAPIVSLDLTACAADGEPLWLTVAPSIETVRVQASDLAEAQSIRTRLRKDHVAAGHGVDSIAVVVDVRVHISVDARTARKELAAAPVCSENSLHYVGTAAGLAGLISDMKAAAVADGVTILPIVTQECAAVVERIIDDVLPRLETCGSVANSAAVESAFRVVGAAGRNVLLGA